MPDGGASIWLPALIGAGASTASAVVGAHAAGSAADTEANAANQARQYSQQASQQALGRLDAGQQGIRYAPTYNAPGVQQSGAYGALAGAMGVGARPAMPASQSPYSAAAVMPSQAGPPILMRSPDGQSTRMVPANQVDHYRQQGAQIMPTGGGNAAPRQQAY